MKLSPYQQAVIDAVTENIGRVKVQVQARTSPSAAVFKDQLKPNNLLIEALAGAGKSTTLWLIAKTLSEEGNDDKQRLA